MELNKIASATSVYDVYGVGLRTSLSLNLPHRDPGEDDIELVVGRPDDFAAARAALLDGRQDWTQVATLDDGAIYMQWGPYIEILVTPGGDKIVCRSLTELALETYEAYLGSFAVSAALLQRGEEPLHSTVVAIGGTAVGLLGESGAGKSTLAALLLQRGGRLVTDDMLRVTFEDGATLAQPGPRRLKLFAEPAQRFIPNGVKRGAWNPGGDKLIIEPAPDSIDSRPVPLAALIRLDAGASGESPAEPELKKLSGLTMFTTLLASAMITRVVTPERLKRQFLFAERLAALAPVFALSYRRTFDGFDKVAEVVEGLCRR